MKLLPLAFLPGVALCSFAHAQSVPVAAFRAKTIYVINQTGKPAVENGADSELSKWGRFQMADDADSADIRLVIYRQGATESQSETPDDKTPGKMDQSYSTSFTFGVAARAYMKGEKMYFWNGGSSSGSEKGGRGVVDDFRKVFPK